MFNFLLYWIEEGFYFAVLGKNWILENLIIIRASPKKPSPYGWQILNNLPNYHFIRTHPPAIKDRRLILVIQIYIIYTMLVVSFKRKHIVNFTQKKFLIPLISITNLWCACFIQWNHTRALVVITTFLFLYFDI